MLQDILEIALEAGHATLTYYNDDIEVYDKEDESPLTKADLAAHKIIVNKLENLTPQIPIISEESGIPDYEERKDWDEFWIVDPLDGTKEFIKRNGEFTINIALVRDGKPVMGVVYVPAQSLLYYASEDEGAFKKDGDNRPQRIYSTKADTSRPLTIIESRSHGSDKLENYLEEQGVEVKDRVKAGSALNFCKVAENVADLYPRLGPTMEWDVAAGDCVWRYSAKDGENDSPLTYNKPSLKNEGFVIGW